MLVGAAGVGAAGFFLGRRITLALPAPPPSKPWSVFYPAEENGHIYRISWGSKSSRRRSSTEDARERLVLIDAAVLHDLRDRAVRWHKVAPGGISLELPFHGRVSEPDDQTLKRYLFMPWEGPGALPNQIGSLYELKAESRDEKPSQVAARLIHVTRSLVRDGMADDVSLNWFSSDAGGV